MGQRDTLKDNKCRIVFGEDETQRRDTEQTEEGLCLT